jgi:hypothetical protein
MQHAIEVPASVRIPAILTDSVVPDVFRLEAVAGRDRTFGAEDIRQVLIIFCACFVVVRDHRRSAAHHCGVGLLRHERGSRDLSGRTERHKEPEHQRTRGSFQQTIFLFHGPRIFGVRRRTAEHAGEGVFQCWAELSEHYAFVCSSFAPTRTPQRARCPSLFVPNLG